MGINKWKITGIILGLIIILVSSILYFLDKIDSKTFYFILGVGIVVGSIPLFVFLLIQGRREKDLEQMFLEFSRDLVEGVKSGTPINRSIINLRTKDYGSLNTHVDKLANQISFGIPVKEALEIFAKDIGNPIISRAIGLIREAERSGGKIELILESVTASLSQIDKLKKERKAAVFNLAVQGYVIFFIFILVMLIMEFRILPITEQIGGLSVGNLNSGDFLEQTQNSSSNPIANVSHLFLYLLLVQGFFAGLIIGKLSEGNVKAGLKHSFILVAVSWLLSTGAEIIF
jgi:flagellar protein FlaJ